MANVNLDLYTGDYEIPSHIHNDIVRAARATYDIVTELTIDADKSVKGSGLANGFVVLTRTTRVSIDGKSKSIEQPVAFIPINEGHRFPTRFTDGYARDEHGSVKLTRSGAPILKKTGIRKYFNEHLHEQLVKAVYEAVSSGEWSFTLVYNKVVQ